MAGTDASEGQAVRQPRGAEEDSRLREGNRHLHLAYNEEEGGCGGRNSSNSGSTYSLLHLIACSSSLDFTCIALKTGQTFVRKQTS